MDDSSGTSPSSGALTFGCSGVMMRDPGTAVGDRRGCAQAVTTGPRSNEAERHVQEHSGAEVKDDPHLHCT